VGWPFVSGFRGPGFDSFWRPILKSTRIRGRAVRGTYEVQEDLPSHWGVARFAFDRIRGSNSADIGIMRIRETRRLPEIRGPRITLKINNTVETVIVFHVVYGRL
jgi:hypothetical protein